MPRSFIVKLKSNTLLKNSLVITFETNKGIFVTITVCFKFFYNFLQYVNLRFTAKQEYHITPDKKIITETRNSGFTKLKLNKLINEI